MHEAESHYEPSSSESITVSAETHKADLPGCETCTVTERMARESSALFTILNNEGCISACPRLTKLKEELAA